MSKAEQKAKEFLERFSPHFELVQPWGDDIVVFIPSCNDGHKCDPQNYEGVYVNFDFEDNDVLVMVDGVQVSYAANPYKDLKENADNTTAYYAWVFECLDGCEELFTVFEEMIKERRIVALRRFADEWLFTVFEEMIKED